jgi:hypothetical protein
MKLASCAPLPRMTPVHLVEAHYPHPAYYCSGLIENPPPNQIRTTRHRLLPVAAARKLPDSPGRYPHARRRLDRRS